ncbi:MAG: DUF1223 domain-containing protein [Pseudomonadota bacterium]
MLATLRSTITSTFAAASVLAALTMSALPAAAQNTAVVELYTSQGCSSCPPADALLHELAKRDDVIALALHVDYWDYIGWKDQFAHAAFTERQKGYARAAGARTIYTPQMVIGGKDHVIGNRPGEVAAILAKHYAKAPAVDLDARREGNLAIVSAPSVRMDKEMIVQIVTYMPSATVAIKRGENAGRTLDYTNVVTSWTVAARWDGDDALSMQVDIPSTDPAIVLIQAADHGEILASAKLN